MQKDLVSVGLPVKNGATKLPMALEALLSQTYTNFEIIISDNASTDETQEVCEKYASKDSRIRYIRQDANIGLKKNFVAVLQKARGEYFMWAADDDWWNARFIESAKNALDTHPEFGVAMCSVERQYDDGVKKDLILYTDQNSTTSMSQKELLYRMMSEYPTHIFLYGLYRTPLLKAVMSVPFPECKSFDRVIMCELALCTKFYSIPEILHVRTVRRPTSEPRFIYNDRFKQTKYVIAMCKRLLFSRNANILNKFLILPTMLLVFVWQNRVFLREWFPRFFRAVLEVKGVARKILGLHI